MEDVIEIGVDRCDECGGSGELPDGECPICFGDGYLSWVVTLAEFRHLAGIGPGPHAEALSAMLPD